MVRIGEEMPDFEAESTDGPIRFHEFMDGGWCVLLMHTADFTPICTTELGAMIRLAPILRQRGAKMLCVSCDSLTSHTAWLADIRHYSGLGSRRLPLPLVADSERRLARMLGVLDPDFIGDDGQPAASRATFLVAPDRRLRVFWQYPATTGRNLDEIVRVLDALTLAARWSGLGTPENWRPGQPCFVMPSLSLSEASRRFPAGVELHRMPSGKQYMRSTVDPSTS